MPENPNPLKPAPWIQELVKDRPAPVAPEVKPEVKVEAPVPPVAPKVDELKKEIVNIDEKAIDAEPAPVLDKAAPVVETPATPAATAPVTPETPAAVAPTVPVNPPPAAK